MTVAINASGRSVPILFMIMYVIFCVRKSASGHPVDSRREPYVEERHYFNHLGANTAAEDAADGVCQLRDDAADVEH